MLTYKQRRIKALASAEVKAKYEKNGLFKPGNAPPRRGLT